MSAPQNANPCCSTNLTTQIPGSPGPTGSAGAAGATGKNATSILQGSFVCPVIGSNTLTLTVDQNSWMIVGQPVYVSTAGFFSVASLSGTTGVVLTYLNYNGNTNSGNVIAAGSQISPGATQPSLTIPWPIADGGTNATTKAGAQSNLGLGASPMVSAENELAQAITTSISPIGTIAVAIASAGVYLVLASVTVDYSGVTFASDQSLTLEVVGTLYGQFSLTFRNTQTPTTTIYPAIDYVLPFAVVTLAAGETLALKGLITATPSAGTAKFSAGSLVAIPIALS